MSIFGSIGRAASTVAGALSTAVKTVAKGVRATVGAVANAVGGVGGAISTAFNKVKSFGSSVLGMILPNTDNTVISALQSATASDALSGGSGFAGAFGDSLISASNKSGGVGGFRTITQRIKDALGWVGGKVKDAATRIYDKTVEFLGGGKKATDRGDWIATNAKDAPVSKLQAETIKLKENTGFMVDSGIYDRSNGLGVSQLIGKPEIPLSLEQQPLNVQYDAARRAGMDPKLIETSRKVGISPFAGAKAAQKIMDKGIVGSGLTNKDLPAPPEPIIRPTSVRSAPSFLDKVLSYAPDFLDAFGAGLNNPLFPEEGFRTGGGVSPSLIGANRMAIGGKGAAGGDFLSAAQQAFFNQQKSRLERLG